MPIFLCLQNIYMSLNSELNIEQFHQLILNASAYMTKIESFSFKIANASIQSILKCLNIASEILKDQNSPMIKKLYVLRFIKDTMILASLPFYQCVLVKIMPWIITASKISETNIVEKRIEMMGRLLKGSQYDVNVDANISKSILQLAEQLIKWMGTTIRDHPYSKIHFQSAFRVIMERVPRIKNMRITDLTFFKPDDPNKYQAYYMERQSGEAEGERIFEYVAQMVELFQKDKPLPDLQALIQTGDQYAISGVIDEIQGILENVKPNNVLNMLTLVEFVHRLFMIGDVQFVNLAKDYLLQKVLIIVQILHAHKVQFKSGAAQIKRIVSMIKSWNSKCQSLLLPVEAFRQAFRLLAREGIQANDVQQLKMDYRPQIGLTFEINKQKLNQIDCNESGAIKRIRACKYVAVYESVPYSNREKEKDEDIHNQSHSQNYQFLSSNKSNSKHSKISENSMYYKKQFLQAFSKFPQQANLIKNTQQVNQIHLQHSNLSQQFQHINKPVQLLKKPISASQSSQKPLIMSFKKPQKQKQVQLNSPQVVFSDSFTSNQKASPYKLFYQKDFVDIIQQPSMEVHSQHTVKDSGSGSHKNPSSQNSSNPFAKGSKASVQDQKAIINYNDYMFPQKNEDSQPQKTYKSSKEGSKLKKEKSSSLSRPNNRFHLKNSSREKIVVSPVSRISNAKSINILQFNEAQYPVQQRYKPEASAKNIPPPPVEQIKVERTIMKPKFGFKIQQESIATQSQSTLKKGQNMSYSLSKSKSLSSIYTKRQQQRTLGIVPDNFLDLLNVKPQKVQVNGFDNKVKQLQRQIERMKQKKQKAVKVVLLKNLEIQKLKSEMPLPKEQLQEENTKLRKAMQPKKSQQPELVYRLVQPFETKAIMKHVSVTPLRQEIKKQILYSKCRLYKNEYVEIGFQAKNKQLSFYFTFLMPIQQCTVKVQENSLILAEEIDMRIYKIIQGKQIKFKSCIKDHRYFNEQFQMASLIVRLQALKKKAESIQVSIPFHIYNIIEFSQPKSSQKYGKITDWHYSCQGILTNPHYLTDFFPKIKCQGAIFSLRASIQYKYAEIRIIINNDKFAIEFQGNDETFELIVIRCIMSLLQKSSL